MSGETVKRLEWYNSLPEEEQLAVNYFPYGLYAPAGYGNSPDMPAKTEDALSKEEPIAYAP